MNNTPVKLTILQMNDSHAYFRPHQELFWEGGQAVYRPAGGYAEVAALVKSIRAEKDRSVLFFDCGDTMHGTYPAIQTKGGAMVPVLNALELDAMTVHWEFAYGPKRLLELASQMRFPVLAANVFSKDTGAPFLPPYAIKTVGPLRIGVIGLASNIVDKTMPPHFSEGIRFTMGEEELPTIVATLREKERADMIILISHLGFPQEMKLLSKVPGIDVCLSGHTHNRLHAPVVQGGTVVMQSGCHGSFIGRLDLELRGGKITHVLHRLIEVTGETGRDGDMAALIDSVVAPYEDELNVVVGETRTALNRNRMLETTMDNFLLASIREACGTQLAFSNGWRYGAPVVQGPIRVNDLYNMIPMNPPLSTVELTGQEILDMLEENLERTFSHDPYGQMGGYVKRGLGLTVFLKIENPAGHRVQQIFIGSEALQRDATYTAAFVTDQGVAKKYGRNRKDLPIRAVEAMTNYLAGHSPLSVELAGSFVAV